MQWEFNLPVQIVFGNKKSEEIKTLIESINGTCGLLICSKSFTKNGIADKLVSLSDGKIKKVFSDVRPNPTTDNVNECVEIIRNINADFAIALGGGSPMDCCKAACAIAKGADIIESYHSGGKPIDSKEAIPMIAITTTSGTASEITNISVLTDVSKNLKQPMNDPAMYPKIAVIDPELTLTVPPAITASTGLDVLSHAIESFWSKKRQPICSACSVYAAKLVFQYLELAYNEPDNLFAREKMAEASIVAGVAFSHPRTTGSHACSFPLTNTYHVPHGEACAFTLDYYVKYNARLWNDDSLNVFAKECGFDSPNAMADRILEMKKNMKMRCSLSEIGCTTKEQIDELTKQSISMLLENNPVKITEKDVREMYESLA